MQHFTCILSIYSFPLSVVHKLWTREKFKSRSTKTLGEHKSETWPYGWFLPSVFPWHSGLECLVKQRKEARPSHPHRSRWARQKHKQKSSRQFNSKLCSWLIISITIGWIHPTSLCETFFLEFQFLNMFKWCSIIKQLSYLHAPRRVVLWSFYYDLCRGLPSAPSFLD